MADASEVAAVLDGFPDPIPESGDTLQANPARAPGLRRRSSRRQYAAGRLSAPAFPTSLSTRGSAEYYLPRMHMGLNADMTKSLPHVNIASGLAAVTQSGDWECLSRSRSHSRRSDSYAGEGGGDEAVWACNSLPCAFQDAGGTAAALAAAIEQESDEGYSPGLPPRPRSSYALEPQATPMGPVPRFGSRRSLQLSRGPRRRSHPDTPTHDTQTQVSPGTDVTFPPDMPLLDQRHSDARSSQSYPSPQLVPDPIYHGAPNQPGKMPRTRTHPLSLSPNDLPPVQYSQHYYGQYGDEAPACDDLQAAWAKRQLSTQSMKFHFEDPHAGMSSPQDLGQPFPHAGRSSAAGGVGIPIPGHGWRGNAQRQAAGGQVRAQQQQQQQLRRGLAADLGLSPSTSQGQLKKSRLSESGYNVEPEAQARHQKEVNSRGDEAGRVGPTKLKTWESADHATFYANMQGGQGKQETMRQLLQPLLTSDTDAQSGHEEAGGWRGHAHAHAHAHTHARPHTHARTHVANGNAGGGAGAAARGSRQRQAGQHVPLIDGRHLSPVSVSPAVQQRRGGGGGGGDVTPTNITPTNITPTNITPTTGVGAGGVGLLGGGGAVAGHHPPQPASTAGHHPQSVGAGSDNMHQQEDPLQPFLAYLAAEAKPGDKMPTADVVWGQTERDRVYNFLLYVPVQLERLIQFGTLLCLDSFLALFTVLPCRVMWALALVAMGRKTATVPTAALVAAAKPNGAGGGGGGTEKSGAGAQPPTPVATATKSDTATAGVPAPASVVSVASVAGGSDKEDNQAPPSAKTKAQEQQPLLGPNPPTPSKTRPTHRGGGVLSGAEDKGPSVSHVAGTSEAGTAPGSPITGSSSLGALSKQGGGGSSSAAATTQRTALLHSSQVFDILCLLILVMGTVVMRAIKPGFIYYWLKDITSEFLKMSVLSSAFEIADKILGNFGLDVLEALSGTCTMWVAGRRGAGRQLIADALVAFAITLLHAITLMCQGLVLAVALNSKRNGLLALLIANNFVEIKGAVFKRWDVPRIWGLVCQDIVERLHLLAVIGFVLVEDMDSAGCWVPGAVVLWESARILASEVVIDIVKHAVLGKFNDVRPGIYREYMKDLCDKAVAAQSHSLHKLMAFHHLAPGCLVLRTLTTLFWLKLDGRRVGQVAVRVGVVVLGWGCLLVAKPVLGYALKFVAHRYVSHYQRTHPKAMPRPPNLHQAHHHRALRGPDMRLVGGAPGVVMGGSGGGALPASRGGGVVGWGGGHHKHE